MNVLPVRLESTPGEPFDAVLERVQGAVIDAFEHRRVTFGWLLRQLTLSRDPGRIPLVSVTFNLDPPLSDLRFAGLTHRLEANPRSAFQFDLGVNCDTTADGFRVISHYNTDLFDAATIRAWLGDFRTLLEAAATDPTLSIAPAAAAPILLWPSSPTAGGDPVYDDVLYNAMRLDKSRHDAYRRAFAKVARDKVVVDIGTGRDALLARMALEEGARKVYAIELLERPARQAKELIEKLGLQDKIIVLHGRSQQIQLPERADICVSENVGHIGGAEGGDLILADARERFLKPHGLIIPARCRTQFAAVTLPPGFLRRPEFEALGGYYAGDAWRQAGYKHDLRLCLMGLNRNYLSTTEATFEDVEFAATPAREYRREETLTATRDALIDGFALWLQLETVPGETLTAIDHSDSWLPVYLPVFDPPIPLARGETIRLTIRGALAANGLNRDYHLEGAIHRAGGETQTFRYDSWHYKHVYKSTPFYARLFASDRIPLAAGESAAAGKPAAIAGPDRPIPRDQGVHQIFARQAEQHPDAIALIDGPTRLTYRELNTRAEILAASLPAATAIGLLLDRSADFIVAILATLKAGSSYVSLDPAQPDERLATIAADAGLTLILTRPPFHRRTLPSHIPTRDLTAEPPAINGAPLDTRHPTPDTPAYIMFTSGSTGRPKGAEIPHAGITRLVVNTDYVEFLPSDVMAHASNVAFDAATFEIWGALLNGARLQIVPRDAALEPRAFVATLREQGVTILFLTTPLFHQFAREVPEAFGFLRYLVVGGDALDPAAARLVLSSATPPRHLINGYGPTETTTFAICHRVEHVPPGATSIPIGRPIANTHIYLLDEERRPVPPGERGEIYIGGPGVARGYANRPELTAASFLPDPGAPQARVYKTGDLARTLPDGTIEFLGRIDDQVKIRGFRVEPAEVEAALQTHPEVGLAKVRAQANGPAGPDLIGYVTPRNGRAPAGEELRTFLRSRLPDYFIPSSIMVLEAMPLTPNGKIDFAALPQPSLDSPLRGSSTAPRTGLEKELTQLWQGVLGGRAISVTDDFFLIGGHSLLAIQMIGRLRERFAVEVPVRQLFETPTIEGLAAYIDAQLPRETEAPYELLVPIQRGEPGRRPVFLVPGGWGGETEFLVYAALARQLDPALPLYGLRARRKADGGITDDPVEKMAADAISEMRRFQPEGPYLLGGECVGGVIAYEMASLLERGGERVDLLLLLDTDWPSASLRRWFDRSERRERWRLLWDARVRQPWLAHREKLSRLGFAEKCSYVWERLVRKRALTGSAAAPDDRALLGEYPRKLMAHTPAPYSGSVSLLVAETVSLSNPTLGWAGAHHGPLEIHIVPGDHRSYIREHAPTAAAKLRELIARAEQASATLA